MNDVKTHRPIPLVLTTLIAVFSALVALMLSGGHAAHAHGPAAHHTDTHTISRSEFALRTDMRKLVNEHFARKDLNREAKRKIIYDNAKRFYAL